MEEKQKTITGIDIRLSHLTKEFPSRNGNGEMVVAVNDFDVVIPGGKLVGLLGPSGCGKSTTLYMIAGLYRPTSGEIYFGDENVTNYPPEKRGIGLVFQNYALYPHMTVKENIMFPLEQIKPALSKEVMLEKTKEVANLVQIGELLERKPNELSGGQQQRVAIARALVKKPKVLLLDEPLSNLDARLRLQTREEIKRIQRETGVTTVFVTHDQEEAMSISDEIVVMNHGIEQQKDVPQKVYDEPNCLFVAKFLGNPPINIIDGEIASNKLKLLNGEVIKEVSGIKDGKVKIGLRPEFFEVDEQGPIRATIEIIQHIGRDSMILCRLEQYEKPIRLIVPSLRDYEEGQQIRINYKKIFVFNDDEDGGRIV